MNDVLSDPRLSRLLHAGMGDQAVVTRAEENWPALGPTPPAELSTFDDIRSVRAMTLDPEALSALAREFHLCAGWHGARERPELEKAFRRRAQNVHKCLREKLN